MRGVIPPLTYVADTINHHFLSSLIASIDEDEHVADVFVRLLLAINLHFVGKRYCRNLGSQERCPSKALCFSLFIKMFLIFKADFRRTLIKKNHWNWRRR